MFENAEQEIDYQNQIVYQLYQQGQYTQGLELALQVDEAARQHLSESHPQYTLTLNNLGILYQAVGNYAAAESILLQALEIRRKSLREQDPYFAQSLNNLAELYRQTGRYATAEPLYKQALSIRRIALGDNHPGVATILNNLGLLYQATGNYIDAEAPLLEAVAINSKTYGEDSLEFAQSLNNLGVLYRSMDSYARAQTLYKQALEIRRTRLGENNPLVAMSLDNLAELSRQTANYSEAERLFLQSQKILRSTLGESHPDVATNLNNLAELYREIGSYDKAEASYLEALDIWEAVQDYPSYFTTMTNLGVLYQGVGQFELAEMIHKQTLEVRRKVLGENHPVIAQSLNNLAAVYQETRNYEAAESFYRQALEVRRKILPENHSDIAQSLNNLGVLYLLQGNYSEAEPLLRQALAIYYVALKEQSPDFAEVLFNVAHLCIATHRIDEAMVLMEQASTLDEQLMGQVFSIGSERQRLTYMLTIQGRFDKYLSTLLQYLPQFSEAVLAGFDRVLRRKAVGVEALMTQRDAILNGLYPKLAPQLQELTALRLQIAQKTLGGPGSESIEAYNNLLGEWNNQKDQLEAELARQIPEMALERKLRAANRRAVASALPQGSVLIEFVRFDVFDFLTASAQGKPQRSTAHYLAFVLPSDSPDNVQMVGLGDADTIDRSIAAFRMILNGNDEVNASDEAIYRPPLHDVSSPSNPIELANERNLGPASRLLAKETYLREGRALRITIFDPLMAALAGRTRLFLAPDGDLTRLPFEVLPTDDDQHLIDNYHISYLSVGRDVLRFQSTSAAQPTVPLVIADPDFDLNVDSKAPSAEVEGSHAPLSRDLKGTTLRFRRLPGSLFEGQQIAAQLGVQPLLGREAVKVAIKSSRSPRVLHIATHGFFLPNQIHDSNKELVGEAAGAEKGLLSFRPENPLLRSGLALAAANTWLQGTMAPPEAENGLLTAEDVSGLDLLATELVVLSACETGLGKIQTGEGVFGLRRAFQLAGAKTLVMSLWKVPDWQTQKLMIDFYRRLLAGQPRADALRGAQLAIKEVFPHPYYWAAFICQGVPGPLVRE